MGNKVVVVFSGGKDPWQSMGSLISLIEKWLINSENVKIVFLASSEVKENSIFKKLHYNCDINII